MRAILIQRGRGIKGPLLRFDAMELRLSLDVSMGAGAQRLDPKCLGVAGWQWSEHGTQHATIALKMRIKLVVDGEAIPLEAEPLLPGSAEVAPLLPFAQLTLVGHAYAPGGSPCRTSRVRVALLRGERTVLDKSILVVGDRAHADDEPAPWKAMPLAHERAPATAWNPFGRAASRGDAPPNLVPTSPSDPMACFAPIPSGWPSRAAHLRGRSLAFLDADVPALDDVDPRWFLDAPQDQWLAQLEGDETLVLDGVSSHAPRLATRLRPIDARLAWRVGRLSGTAPMKLDCISVDVDRGEACLVRRGHFTLPAGSSETFADITVVAWPGDARPARAGFGEEQTLPNEGTLLVASAPPARDPLPFSAARSAAEPAVPAEFADGAETNVLTVMASASAPRAPASPFAGQSAFPVAPVPQAAQGDGLVDRLMGLTVVRDAIPHGPPLPFAAAGSREVDIEDLMGPTLDVAIVAPPGAPATERVAAPPQAPLPPSASMLDAMMTTIATPEDAVMRPAVPFRDPPPGPEPVLAPPPPRQVDPSPDIEALMGGTLHVAAPQPTGPALPFGQRGAGMTPEPAAAAPPPPAAMAKAETSEVTPAVPRPLFALGMPLSVAAPVPAAPRPAPATGAAPSAGAPRGVGDPMADAAFTSGELAGGDLRGVDLCGRDLRGAKLRGARLEGARMRGILFDDADLEGATLRDADLEYASLDRALLTDADLEGAQLRNASLQGAHLRRARLGRATLDRARLGHAKLDAASLVDASLEHSVLARASLREADLAGARLHAADLEGVDASSARLVGADLTRSSAPGSDFTGADLQQARLDDASWGGATLERARLDRASLRGADLAEAHLGDAILTGADMRGASLRGAILSHVSCEGARLEGADVRGADLEGTTLPRGEPARRKAARGKRAAR